MVYFTHCDLEKSKSTNHLFVQMQRGNFDGGNFGGAQTTKLGRNSSGSIQDKLAQLEGDKSFKYFNCEIQGLTFCAHQVPSSVLFESKDQISTYRLDSSLLPARD